MKRFIKDIVGVLGYQVKKIPKSSDPFLEQQIDADIKAVRPYTMLSRARLASLYKQVKFCEENNIHGGYVECGVWKGGAVALMALANRRFGKDKRNLHLFDAFQEICEPDASVDGARALAEVRQWADGGQSGKLRPLKGIYDTFGGAGSLEGNKWLLEEKIGYDKRFLHYHPGWFQETVPQATDNIGNIAILRLDGDWYASTKVCLDYLYGSVVSGGFVIVDDYGTYEGCKKAVDEFMDSMNARIYLNDVDEECKYWIKP